MSIGSNGHVYFARVRNQERFSSLAHLQQWARDFETFHNANYRYLVYEYVTAVLDLAIPAEDGNLRVLREGAIVATASVRIGGR